MPEWLQIVLGVAGTANTAGVVAWIFNTLGALKTRTAIVEAEVANIKQKCVMCGDEKTELFQRLRRVELTTTAMAVKMGVHIDAE